MTVTQVRGCRIHLERGWLTSQSHLYISFGRKTLLVGQMSQQNYDYGLRYQRTAPWLLCTLEGWQYWMFENLFYKDDERRTQQQLIAHFVMKREREARKIQRQMAMTQTTARPGTRSRTAIPDEVKVLVFRRDQGRCVECGSAYEIQFDHVIPFAMGGSNEPENLQLLCAPCNRRKRDRLTVQPRR